MSYASLAALAVLLAVPAWCGALSTSQTKGAATLSVRAEHDRPNLALSDVLYVSLAVEAGPGLKVEAPARLLASSAWSILRRGQPTTKQLETGRVRWQQSFTLAPLAPGAHTLDVAPLRYRDSASDWQTATWEPIAISVETQIKSADVALLRDITSVEEVSPPEPGARWAWLLVIPGAVAVLAAGLALRRKRRTSRVSTPAEVAWRELERLTARGLPKKGKGRSFTILLVGVVRRYLERRYDLPARRLTSDELLARLEGVALDESARQTLREFFVAADVARFAPGAAQTQVCAALAELARRFLQGETSRTAA